MRVIIIAACMIATIAQPLWAQQNTTEPVVSDTGTGNPPPDKLVQDALEQITQLQQTIAHLKEQLVEAQIGKAAAPMMPTLPATSLPSGMTPADIPEKDRPLVSEVCQQLGFVSPGATSAPPAIQLGSVSATSVMPVSPPPPTTTPQPPSPPSPPAAKMATPEPTEVPTNKLADTHPPDLRRPPPKMLLPKKPNMIARTEAPARPAANENETQAVLERLRQHATPEPAAAPPSSSAPNDPREGLEMAREALRDGRTEDARRLLQLVQLQLVFTHEGSQNLAGTPQGALDVAHALEALGNHNTDQSQENIGHALAQLSDARR